MENMQLVYTASLNNEKLTESEWKIHRECVCVCVVEGARGKKSVSVCEVVKERKNNESQEKKGKGEWWRGKHLFIGSICPSLAGKPYFRLCVSCVHLYVCVWSPLVSKKLMKRAQVMFNISTCAAVLVRICKSKIVVVHPLQRSFSPVPSWQVSVS